MNTNIRNILQEKILKEIRYYPDGLYCWRCGKFDEKSHSVWSSVELASKVYPLFVKNFAEDPELKFYSRINDFFSNFRTSGDPAVDVPKMTEEFMRSLHDKLPA